MKENMGGGIQNQQFEKKRSNVAGVNTCSESDEEIKEKPGPSRDEGRGP